MVRDGTEAEHHASSLSVSSMEIFVQWCFEAGFRRVVLSPGSRSAPLTLALARHSGIDKWVVPDERSAAFVALGLSLREKTPTMLCCTSGSAVLNYFPAVAEAHFQCVPLLILTADRPPEWLFQEDGQTLPQGHIFSSFTKAFFEFPMPDDHPDTDWHAHRLTQDALHTCLTTPYGPVHLNFPFREPLYDGYNSGGGTQQKTRVLSESSRPVRVHLSSEPGLIEEAWATLSALWEKYDRVLILCGQHHDSETLSALSAFASQFCVPVLADLLAQGHALPQTYTGTNTELLFLEEDKACVPEVLLSFGGSLLSKSMKAFWRKHPPKVHLKLWPDPTSPPDTLQSLTHTLSVAPATFFAQAAQRLPHGVKDPNYLAFWQKREASILGRKQGFWSRTSRGMFKAVYHVLRCLPEDCFLHLGNSMPVRYACHVGLKGKHQVRVFANRGLSGIDGCLSTALGMALANPERLHVLLIGDMSFFYDRNGLWHRHVPANLRLVVLNDNGGGIFRMLPGADRLPECEPYFVAPHHQSAEGTCRQAQIDYLCAQSETALLKHLKHFFQPKKQAQLLEHVSSGEEDAVTFKRYLNHVSPT